MAKFRGGVARQKNDITKIFRLRKALISWSYQQICKEYISVV
jgi:hypothetical protein